MTYKKLAVLLKNLERCKGNGAAMTGGKICWEGKNYNINRAVVWFDSGYLEIKFALDEIILGNNAVGQGILGFEILRLECARGGAVGEGGGGEKGQDEGQRQYGRQELLHVYYLPNECQCGLWACPEASRAMALDMIL